MRPCARSKKPTDVVSDPVKTAFDELRMQMLGTQVLFGFQLNSAFQDAFERLSPQARAIDAAGLFLVVVTLALLIAPPSQHRLTDRGRGTRRILDVAHRFAEVALLPVAIVMGCDGFVVAEPHFGAAVAAAFGVGISSLAILTWYGVGRILRSHSKENHAMPDLPKDDLHRKVEHMLTESRVILPGAQALLGFQFVVTLTKSFGDLPEGHRVLHFCALAAIAVSIVLLIAPAAIHRITFRGRDTAQFHTIGSRLVTAALLPLSLGIAADVYVATEKMIGIPAISAAAAGSALVFLLILWYAVPLALRPRRALS